MVYLLALGDVIALLNTDGGGAPNTDFCVPLWCFRTYLPSESQNLYVFNICLVVVIIDLKEGVDENHVKDYTQQVRNRGLTRTYVMPVAFQAMVKTFAMSRDLIQSPAPCDNSWWSR